MSDSGRTITTRQELIDDSIAGWNEFTSFVDGLDDDQWLAPVDPAGWSVKDHVAHITGWDRAEREVLLHGGSLQHVLGISDEAWKSEDFDRINEEIRQPTMADSPAAVRATRDAVWNDVLLAMHGLDDEQLAASTAGTGLEIGAEPPERPLVALLVEHWGEHYREHLGYIKLLVEPAGK